MPIITTCKICGKPAVGRKGRGAYCAGSCYRQHERNYSNRHRATFSLDRRRANILVGCAIAKGDLIRGACEICSSRNYVEAHHDDYAEPLNVRWLCKSHHKQHHIKFGPGKNAYA